MFFVPLQRVPIILIIALFSLVFVCVLLCCWFSVLLRFLTGHFSGDQDIIVAMVPDVQNGRYLFLVYLTTLFL
jgi:hypothetical protein